MIEVCILAVVLMGLWGVIVKRNLLLKIIALDVMSTGVIGYFVHIAARTGLFTPILAEIKTVDYADPVPQAVILTAIVIGFSSQAVLLVAAMKLARENPTLESAEIEAQFLQPISQKHE